MNRERRDWFSGAGAAVAAIPFGLGALQHNDSQARRVLKCLSQAVSAIGKLETAKHRMGEKIGRVTDEVAQLDWRSRQHDRQMRRLRALLLASFLVDGGLASIWFI